MDIDWAKLEAALANIEDVPDFVPTNVREWREFIRQYEIYLKVANGDLDYDALKKLPYEKGVRHFWDNALLHPKFTKLFKAHGVNLSVFHNITARKMMGIPFGEFDAITFKLDWSLENIRKFEEEVALNGPVRDPNLATPLTIKKTFPIPIFPHPLNEYCGIITISQVAEQLNLGVLQNSSKWNFKFSIKVVFEKDKSELKVILSGKYGVVQKNESQA